jgi:hypothetical protein
MRPAPRTQIVAGLIGSALLASAAVSTCEAADPLKSMIDPGRSRDLVNRPTCWSCEHLDNPGRCEMSQE